MNNIKEDTLFKVRDLREKTQFKIDDEYLNGYAKYLGVSVSAVYMSLCRHAEFNSQKCFPSQKLIAEQHNITERTVRSSIKKLKEFNIIQIKREKTKEGKWLNNIYFLMDKNVWKKPEENKDLWKTRGKKEHKPEENKDQTRGNQRPIKDTNTNDIYIKDINTCEIKNFAETLPIKKERKDQDIFDIIELFKPINPSYERFFSNKSQRAAAQRLLKIWGKEKLIQIISCLSKTNKIKYAPTITTICQLEQKIGSLIAFIQKEKGELAKNKILKI